MIKSHISNHRIKNNDVISAKDLHENIFEFIKIDFPDFTLDSYITTSEFNKYRRLYLAQLIANENHDIDAIEEEVFKAFRDNAILSENLDLGSEANFTFGEKVADKIASFGGSWTFILSFLSFLIIWILINIWLLATNAFDPYPFILLNLILSCVAAIQAPIIMMSQNRQEQKDRKQSELDFKTNLKAELEIKLLHEKMDHLLLNQSKKMMEMQAFQIEYLDDLLKQIQHKQ